MIKLNKTTIIFFHIVYIAFCIVLIWRLYNRLEIPTEFLLCFIISGWTCNRIEISIIKNMLK